MNAAFRHLSVRLWLTAFFGGMTSIFLLPWWQEALGVGWLVLPAAGIIGGCFAWVGWGMNRIGLCFLNRHVNAATAWERAGMMADAEAEFRKAMATYDSFWLSPLLRQGKLQWFSGLMARFYLGQNSSGHFVRSLVSTHLKQFPHDKAVAEPWLEQLLAYERHLPQEHESVACVGACLDQHQRVQRLLMQFYLANGRIDFDALQTYRRVWSEQQPLPKETVQRLSRLLCNEFYLNNWAFHVYIKAYESGGQEALEGIAAGVKWLPVSEESKPHLDAAKKILGELDQRKLEQLDARFKSDHEEKALYPKPDPEKDLFHKLAEPLTPRGSVLSLSGFLKMVRPWVNPLRQFIMDRRLQRTFTGIAVGVVLAVTVVIGWRFFNRRVVAEPDARKTVEVKIEITDPFTVQVAAYLKAEDAQRFVDQLRHNELDAFWTRATNAANRTWYQVKVSHFMDRQGAERFGQELKAKGLIDDFYVANYEHDKRHDSKD